MQQIIFVFVSVFTFIFIILKIRKNGLNIEDSIIWLLWAIFLLVISFFPSLPTFISDKLGFMATSNFVFSLFIFFLYILLFLQSIQISKLKDKQRELIQKISIKDFSDRKKRDAE